MATPDGSAESTVMDTMVASFSQYHKDITSKKVKKITYAKAAAGYLPSRAVLGYTNVENPDKTHTDKMADRIVIPHPEMGKLMTEFFQMYATGSYNVYELIDIFYEKGLRSKTGKKTAPSVMYRFLANPFYIGELKWGHIHIKKAKHEPLIDKATFDQVQLVLKAHTGNRCRRRKHKWLLGGLLFCPIHNRKFTGEVKYEKKKIYYRCTNPTGCGLYCDQVLLEEAVAEKFKDLQFSESFTNNIIEKTKGMFDSQVKDYDRNRQTLVNMRTAWEAKRKTIEDKIGLIDDETFKRMINECNGELKSLSVRLSELEDIRGFDANVAQEIISFSKNIYQVYKKASFDLKRNLLTFFWEKFEVQDGQLIKAHSTPFFQMLITENKLYQKSPETLISLNIKRSELQLIDAKLGAYWDLNPD